ncbi:MAG TPA: hypothetical protein DEG43_06600, partial [Acidimicrobiaceae bacterium]|nr:hypothetical protein [Acidimicrobiaceae bacterium]
MARSCRRPGCSRTAAATISYDASACQIWLDPIVGGPLGGQPLCDHHVRHLSPPRGWVMVDRRESQVAILSGDPVAHASATASSKPRPTARKWGSFQATSFEFVGWKSPDSPGSLPPVAEPSSDAE